MTLIRNVVGLALLSAHFAVRATMTRRPRVLSLPERLEMLPTQGVPLCCGVDIRWSEYCIPFIEAENDTDLATALGLVHAHLRIAEMELLRRLAQGRLSETIGPIALDLDHFLRILDLGRAVPEMRNALPEQTRRWVSAFVSGVNHYLQCSAEPPYEFRVLGIESAQWDVSDILLIGRLASADINWIVWAQLLRLRRTKHWAQIWRRLRDKGAVRFAGVSTLPTGLSHISRALGPAARWASNSIAVSAHRSATGGAIIASDPHLGIHLPGAWLIAGYKTPTRNVVGLMPPGLPFVALGRNPWITWGGTNLHAASSDFYDVSELANGRIEERRDVIRTRWWPDREVTLRDTPLGPIVSDARLLGLNRENPIALRWMGHRPSDEITAMHKVEQARDWEEFRTAIEGISVPGQTMIFADTKGRVGRARAAWLPDRPSTVLDSLVLDRTDEGLWRHVVTGSALPAEYDPSRGFVVSANEWPGPSPVPIGFFFSPADRARRLTDLLSAKAPMTLDGVKSLQADVFGATSLELCRRFLELLPSHELARVSSLGRALAEWDGRYEARSTGALAFELVFHGFVHEHYSEAIIQAYWATWAPRSLVLKDLSEGDPEIAAFSLRRAMRRSARSFERFGCWGQFHRLRLSHPFGLIPVVGRRYVLSDAPADGGEETVYKTASRLGDGRRGAVYGSCARHISDLSDPDQNFFVVLGGQDGWVGSANFADQLPLWREGQYLQVPLRPETARTRFTHRTELVPLGCSRTDGRAYR